LVSPYKIAYLERQGCSGDGKVLYLIYNARRMIADNLIWCRDGVPTAYQTHSTYIHTYVIPPLPSTIIYRPTNETQEYGKDDWSKRIESSLCSGLPCQGLTGSNLVVLLTPNYSISSTGLFRANRRNLPSLMCTIQACRLPARLAPYTMRRRPARRSPAPREIVVPASPSRCGVAVLGHLWAVAAVYTTISRDI
jgi:hypothetical protein